jgi:hypothetical protein
VVVEDVVLALLALGRLRLWLQGVEGVHSGSGTPGLASKAAV